MEFASTLYYKYLAKNGMPFISIMTFTFYIHINYFLVHTYQQSIESKSGQGYWISRLNIWLRWGVCWIEKIKKESSRTKSGCEAIYSRFLLIMAWPTFVTCSSLMIRILDACNALWKLAVATPLFFNTSIIIMFKKTSRNRCWIRVLSK